MTINRAGNEMPFDLAQGSRIMVILCCVHTPQAQGAGYICVVIPWLWMASQDEPHQWPGLEALSWWWLMESAHPQRGRDTCSTPAVLGSWWMRVCEHRKPAQCSPVVYIYHISLTFISWRLPWFIPHSLAITNCAWLLQTWLLYCEPISLWCAEFRSFGYIPKSGKLDHMPFIVFFEKPS